MLLNINKAVGDVKKNGNQKRGIEKNASERSNQTRRCLPKISNHNTAWKGIISAYFSLSSLKGVSLSTSSVLKSAQNSILFRSQNFERTNFLIAQGKNGGNPLRITEYFNAVKAKIRLSKSVFWLLFFGLYSERFGEGVAKRRCNIIKIENFEIFFKNH